MKPKVVVIGCGIVGAMIAYELSAQLDAEITVIDKQSAAQASTGAALGVLMGVISSKVKGRTWRLREASVRRYQRLIHELKEHNQSVPFNNQGIVSLCFDEKKLPKWEKLREKRIAQGWPLEIWSPGELKTRFPYINLASENEDGTVRTVKAAVYSPADGQVHPVKLTGALMAVAAERGVVFRENVEVSELVMAGDRCTGVRTNDGDCLADWPADWVVVSAGLGSAALTQLASEPLTLMPVLGQAMEIQLPELPKSSTLPPVINGEDIQFVPLGGGRYWLGATVEFPEEGMALMAQEKGLEQMQKAAARFCGAIAQAKIIKTWTGLRPRPVGQPAPVIGPLAGTKNVTLATAHYRNGVLLAPATAQLVCDLLSAHFAD